MIYLCIRKSCGYHTRFLCWISSLFNYKSNARCYRRLIGDGLYLSVLYHILLTYIQLLLNIIIIWTCIYEHNYKQLSFSPKNNYVLNKPLFIYFYLCPCHRVVKIWDLIFMNTAWQELCFINFITRNWTDTDRMSWIRDIRKCVAYDCWPDSIETWWYVCSTYICMLYVSRFKKHPVNYEERICFI